MEKRQQATKNFLQSYRIRKAFEQVSGYDENEDMTTTTTTTATVSPFDEVIEKGQIRLLSQCELPVYVLVLKEWEKGIHLVSTYSAYDFPATNEELSCGRSVVQVWNTRTIFDEVLKKSWLCGKAKESDVKDVFDLWAHSLGNRKLSEDLVERTSAPLDEQSEDDIKTIAEYMDRCLKLMSPVDALDTEMLD